MPVLGLFQTLHGTHPSIVCRAVVKLGDDLLAAVFGLGPKELKFFRDERESGPVVVGNIHLKAEGRKRQLGVSKSIQLSIKELRGLKVVKALLILETWDPTCDPRGRRCTSFGQLLQFPPICAKTLRWSFQSKLAYNTFYGKSVVGKLFHCEHSAHVT